MFSKAIPVWKDIDNYKDKLNVHLVFREIEDSLEGYKIKIAASDWYKLYVNDEFVGAGPARAAQGYARVDEYDLTAFHNNGKNEIVIYVAGFYCKTLTTVWQDSFLAAEIIRDDEVVKYTGRDFECYENERRVRKAERFSVQRYFQEIWDMSADAFGKLVQTVEVAGDIKFISRRVPFAYCGCEDYAGYISRGIFEQNTDKEFRKNAYSFDPFAEDKWGVFDEDEIQHFPYRYVKSLDLTVTEGSGKLPVTLGEGQWMMVDMGRINVGFLRWSGVVEEDTDVIVAYSESSYDGVFDFVNIDMEPVFEYILPAGKEIDAESFEPYTYKCIAFFVKKGSITVNSVGLRSFERDISGVKRPEFGNSKYAKLYDAALRTYAHNALDIIMDCPSRERAGWLCDSYFTGKAEYYFYGDSPVESAFLENYILYTNQGEFPNGVLPMCYPSDPHHNNKFIPQWDMWYVLEVCDYLSNRKPVWDKETFAPTVFGIIDFLERYENSIGLLENLPSWNFIEWSSANTWVYDVNFPTNMLYAGVLDAVAAMYGKPELSKKAEAVRKTVTDIAFDGEVFVDNATRNADGTYTRTQNVSEACQYYGVLFGGVDLADAKYAQLAQHIKNGFANFNKGDRDFCPINAFIGLYLRMNVLSNLGWNDVIAADVEGFFGDMCDETGTLWECRKDNGLPVGSLDHGFASYVATVLPTGN